MLKYLAVAYLASLATQVGVPPTSGQGVAVTVLVAVVAGGVPAAAATFLIGRRSARVEERRLAEELATRDVQVTEREGEFTRKLQHQVFEMAQAMLDSTKKELVEATSRLKALQQLVDSQEEEIKLLRERLASVESQLKKSNGEYHKLVSELTATVEAKAQAEREAEELRRRVEQLRARVNALERR